ncbi:hypothetical protein TNCV_3521901 [Trichonephila clavipes]|nr:hypothetical protein TNCV_3521901 [Trichonephila clavipes]
MVSWSKKNNMSAQGSVDQHLGFLVRQKGSDASWKNDNEPPEEFIDYSDDEKEKAAKQKKKAKNRKRPDDDDITICFEKKKDSAKNCMKNMRVIRPLEPVPAFTPVETGSIRYESRFRVIQQDNIRLLLVETALNIEVRRAVQPMCFSNTLFDLISLANILPVIFGKTRPLLRDSILGSIDAKKPSSWRASTYHGVQRRRQFAGQLTIVRLGAYLEYTQDIVL